MARYRKNVETDEVERLVSLQVEVWLDNDGKVAVVNESAHLGTLAMVLVPDSFPPSYDCVGAYSRPNSKIPVTFMLESLGTVAPKTIEEEGMHTHTTDVQFNALAWLDEPEKVANLNDAEKVQLQNIGIVALNDSLLAVLKTVPRVWTPMADAAMAIMQHASGTQEDFPKPVVVTHHNESVVTGDHSDDSVATLVVGGHKFTVGGKYWKFCAYGLCGGRERYAFTWMDVPESILDE
jgi:hypothetical protein